MIFSFLKVFNKLIHLFPLKCDFYKIYRPQRTILTHLQIREFLLIAFFYLQPKQKMWINQFQNGIKKLGLINYKMSIVIIDSL